MQSYYSFDNLPLSLFKVFNVVLAWMNCVWVSFADLGCSMTASLIITYCQWMVFFTQMFSQGQSIEVSHIYMCPSNNHPDVERDFGSSTQLMSAAGQLAQDTLYTSLWCQAQLFNGIGYVHCDPCWWRNCYICTIFGFMTPTFLRMKFTICLKHTAGIMWYVVKMWTDIDSR